MTAGYHWWRDLRHLFHVACRETTAARRQGAPSGVRAGAGDTSNRLGSVTGPSTQGGGTMQVRYADGVRPNAGVRRVNRMLAELVRAARVRDSLLPAHADMHALNADTACQCQRMLGGER